MKKILFIVLSVATLLSAASCQKTEQVTGQSNVTINVGMPVTKAISDGTTATNLLYEVYYVGTDGQLSQILKSSTELVEKTATLDFTLMRGSSYVVLFWAQSPQAPYGTDNLRSVLMNYTTNNAGNNEDRDAFYGKCEFVVDEDDEKNGNLSCTLERPFSQINFVATDYDQKLTVGGNDVATMTLAQTAVTINNLATTFDVYNGTAAESGTDPGNYPVTFTATTGVEYDDTPGMDYFDDNESRRWVSMNYVLVPNNQKTIDLEAKFTVEIKYANIEDQITNQPVTAYANSSVPVGMNYRTNIVGELFTEEGKIQIDLNPEYLKEDLGVDVE